MGIVIFDQRAVSGLFVSRIDVSFFIGRTFVNESKPFLESFKKCGKSNDAQKMTLFRKNAENPASWNYNLVIPDQDLTSSNPVENRQLT